MTAEDKLEKSLGELASREALLEDALKADADKAHTYDVEFSKAFLSGSGGAELRKHHATVETENFFKEHLQAKAALTFVKTKIKDAQDAVSARQSLLSAELKTNDRFSR